MRNRVKNPVEWLKKRAKRLKPWQIAAIVAIIMIGVAAIAVGVYYGTTRRAPAKVTVNEVTVKGRTYYAEKTFPSDKTISAILYNSDQEQVRSVTLTSPSWEETLTGLDITGKFYIQVTSSGWYWMRDASVGADVQLGDDSFARKVEATESKMSFTGQFAEPSSIDWYYAENETGLSGAGKTSFTLSEKYTMRNYSAFRGYQLRFAVNNTTAINLTSIDYDGTTYDSEDWNTSTSGNTTTYKINITTLTNESWTHHENAGDDVNKTITISGDANINATRTEMIETWGRYLEPGLYEDSWATTPTQAVYLS